MNKTEPITKIMTTDLLTVRYGEPVSHIRTLFEEHNVHHLPVVRDNDLIGIVTWNEFMRATLGDFRDRDTQRLDAMLDQTYELADIMRQSPVTLDVNATVADAAEILGVGEFHSLPVVDGKKLVGIVTSSDLIRYLAGLF